METDNLITQAVKEKLEKGDFTETINKYVNTAVEKVVEELFKKGWSEKDEGEGYKIIKGAIKPILIQALGDANLEDMALKTKAVIHQTIKESSVNKFANTLAGTLALFDNNDKFKSCGNLSLKTILHEWSEGVKSKIDKDFCDDHDFDYTDGGAGFTFCCEVKSRDDFDTYEEATRFLGYGNDKYVHFYVEEIEDLNDEELSKDFSFVFKLRKTYKDTYWVENTLRDLRVADLTYVHRFETYLALVAANLMNIVDVANTHEYDTVNVYE